MEKMNSLTLKLLTIFGLLAFAARDIYRFWTPRALADQLKYARSGTAVLDPNGYLSTDAADFVQRTAESISTYRPLIVVINGIDRSYTNWESGELEVERFATEFAEIAMPNKADREGRLLVLYSVEDDAFRCVIGRQIAGRVVSQRQCERLVTKAQKLVREGQRDKAFTSLAEQLLIADDRRIFAGYFVLIALGLGFALLVRKHSAVKAERKLKLARRLDAIRNMRVKDNETHAFLHDHCSVCLRVLAAAKPELRAEPDFVYPVRVSGTEVNTVTPFSANDERPATPIIPSDIVETANLSTAMDLEPLEFDREARTCGHEFHHKCLAEVRRRTADCPVCASNVDLARNETESALKTLLVSVQKMLFRRHISADEIDGYYTNGKFSKVKYGKEIKEVKLRPVVSEVAFNQTPQPLLA